MKSNRPLRLGAAAILLISAGAILLPRATSYISTSAVVNAPVISVRSPLDGRITASSPAVAQMVKAGQPLAIVEGGFQNRALKAELEGQKIENESKVTALEGQLASLADLRTRLERQRATHVSYSVRKLDAQIRGIEADIRGAEAESAMLGDRLRRTEILAAKGTAASVSAEDDRRAFEASKAIIDRLKARRDEFVEDRAALAEGIIPNSLNGDLDFTGQLNTIAFQVAELSSELVQARTETEAIALRLRQIENERFVSVAPEDGVIVRASSADGSDVLVGDELVQVLDCNRRFVEVVISETRFESIVPGTKATIRLVGSARSFEGTVTAVRGAGARQEQIEYYAEPQHVPAGQLRVIIGIGTVDLTGETGGAGAAAFCHVGRTAEVYFDRSVVADLRLFGIELPWDSVESALADGARTTRAALASLAEALFDPAPPNRAHRIVAATEVSDMH